MRYGLSGPGPRYAGFFRSFRSFGLADGSLKSSSPLGFVDLTMDRLADSFLHNTCFLRDFFHATLFDIALVDITLTGISLFYRSHRYVGGLFFVL